MLESKYIDIELCMKSYKNIRIVPAIYFEINLYIFGFLLLISVSFVTVLCNNLIDYVLESNKLGIRYLRMILESIQSFC